ncbi:MAG: RND multidrug efflux transporter; Acriflavin resistance protein, partial [uncultured Gemmatimonadetes bacterium]
DPVFHPPPGGRRHGVRGARPAGRGVVAERAPGAAAGHAASPAAGDRFLARRLARGHRGVPHFAGGSRRAAGARGGNGHQHLRGGARPDRGGVRAQRRHELRADGPGRAAGRAGRKPSRGRRPAGGGAVRPRRVPGAEPPLPALHHHRPADRRGVAHGAGRNGGARAAPGGRRGRRAGVRRPRAGAGDRAGRAADPGAGADPRAGAAARRRRRGRSRSRRGGARGNAVHARHPRVRRFRRAPAPPGPADGPRARRAAAGRGRHPRHLRGASQPVPHRRAAGRLVPGGQADRQQRGEGGRRGEGPGGAHRAAASRRRPADFGRRRERGRPHAADRPARPRRVVGGDRVRGPFPLPALVPLGRHRLRQHRLLGPHHPQPPVLRRADAERADADGAGDGLRADHRQRRRGAGERVPPRAHRPRRPRRRRARRQRDGAPRAGGHADHHHRLRPLHLPAGRGAALLRAAGHRGGLHEPGLALRHLHLHPGAGGAAAGVARPRHPRARGLAPAPAVRAAVRGRGVGDAAPPVAGRRRLAADAGGQLSPVRQVRHPRDGVAALVEPGVVHQHQLRPAAGRGAGAHGRAGDVLRAAAEGHARGVAVHHLRLPAGRADAGGFSRLAAGNVHPGLHQGAAGGVQPPVRRGRGAGVRLRSLLLRRGRVAAQLQHQGAGIQLRAGAADRGRPGHPAPALHPHPGRRHQLVGRVVPARQGHRGGAAGGPAGAGGARRHVHGGGAAGERRGGAQRAARLPAAGRRGDGVQRGPRRAPAHGRAAAPRPADPQSRRCRRARARRGEGGRARGAQPHHPRRPAVPAHGELRIPRTRQAGRQGARGGDQGHPPSRRVHAGGARRVEVVRRRAHPDLRRAGHFAGAGVHGHRRALRVAAPAAVRAADGAHGADRRVHGLLLFRRQLHPRGLHRGDHDGRRGHQQRHAAGGPPEPGAGHGRAAASRRHPARHDGAGEAHPDDERGDHPGAAPARAVQRGGRRQHLERAGILAAGRPGQLHRPGPHRHPGALPAFRARPRTPAPPRRRGRRPRAVAGAGARARARL